MTSAVKWASLIWQKSMLTQINNDELEDNQLIRLTLSGDKKAFEVLVRRYQKLVYNVTYQLVKSHETASDLTQETFLKAFASLSTFNQEMRFKPWLLKIGSNSALNTLRDRKDVDSFDAMLEDNPQAEPPGKHDVEKEVEWRLSQTMLSDTLDELSPRYKQIFLLRYHNDLSYEDISEITGEPQTTIKALLFRIREKLRKKLTAKMQA